ARSPPPTDAPRLGSRQETGVIDEGCRTEIGLHHYSMKPRPLAVRPEELRAIRRTCSKERAGLGIHEVSVGEAFVEHRGRGRVGLTSSPPTGATSRNRPPRGGLPDTSASGRGASFVGHTRRAQSPGEGRAEG